MRRGVWAGAAIVVAVTAAIPLWLVARDGDSNTAPRPAALVAETNCSKAENAEACAVLVRQLSQLEAAYAKLDVQLVAVLADVEAWQAEAAAGGDPASEAMVAVGTDMVAVESQMDAIQAEIANWEEKLNTVGDDAQLANVDLQNILQKQQQTLQMLSNISKLLYDTAQSVIRKMGG